MKPTEQEINDLAEDHVSTLRNACIGGHIIDAKKASFKQGYRKAISQMQPEWVGDLEEHNCKTFQDNKDVISECFDKGLCSDGGEYWVLPDTIIEELIKAGFALVKVEIPQPPTK